MARTAIARESTRPSRDLWLGIYLNDHLAGATAGLALARRMARSHRGQNEADQLRRLADELDEDRSALLRIMASLDITVRVYKVTAAWLGEKAGRLDDLIARAQRQISELEECRVRAADRLLSQP